MPFQIILKEDVRREIVSVFEWYEKQSLGLGIKFKNEIDSYLTSVEQTPKLFQIVYKKYRHVVLNRRKIRFCFRDIHTKRNVKTILRAITKN